VGTSDRRVVRLIRLFGGGAATIGAYAQEVELLEYPLSRELQVARRHS